MASELLCIMLSKGMFHLQDEAIMYHYFVEGTTAEQFFVGRP